MAAEVSVPRLGWSMDEGTFQEWLKNDGDFVKKGEMLFVLEGDKAAQEIESFDEGYLRLLPNSPTRGDSVKVGQILAYLVAEGESLPVGAPQQAKEPHGKLPEVRVAVTTQVKLGVRERSVAKATPRARRAAGRAGIDWTAVPGSGRNGRVRERDVIAAVNATSGVQDSDAAALRGKLIPISTLQRTIAAHMIDSARQTAPVTLTTKVDATRLVQLRQKWKQESTASAAAVPSFTDMLVKLTAVALVEHPLLQAQWRDAALFVPDEVHIGIAVDAEDGLFVPVIQNAAGLSVREIAVESRRLIELVRSGRVVAQQLQGGTFTITNLGSFDIDAFTPIIQLPQSAILGVGRIVREPAVVDEEIVPRDMLTLSLTFDHRVNNGAPAARFLKRLKSLIEEAKLVG